MKKIRVALAVLFITSVIAFSCTTVDLYEKTVSIPGHSWQNSYKPEFKFIITDTTSTYTVYMVLRHTEKYSFNNIYVNLHIKGPGQDSAVKVQRDLTLATNEKGWLGSGMDDIYEHRIILTEGQTLKAGEYYFKLEQIMREDPLNHVLDAGIRVEKR